MLALPTPPSSPEKSKDDEDDKSEHKVAQCAAGSGQHNSEEISQTATTFNKMKECDRVQISIASWLRQRPVYLTLKTALKDTKLKRIETSPEKNSCMVFSFLLCTGQIKEADQSKR